MGRVTAFDPNKMVLPPMRGNKRIIPIPIDISSLAFEGRVGGGSTGPNLLKRLTSGYKNLLSDEVVQDYRSAKMTRQVDVSDFNQTQVINPGLLAQGLSDFIYVKIKGRGVDGGDLLFRFLVNPNSIQASRQVVDGEAQTRAGIQTGIWGDLLDISISGATAGTYFAGGLVDGHDEYSLSNRNLRSLLAVYENNGFWFEGEAQGDPVFPDDLSRKLIQLHGDVTLAFGNFLWMGAFTDLSLDETADNPYYSKFSINFMAWKERFRTDSPWRNSIESEQYYGHAYEVYKQKGGTTSSTPDNRLADASGAPLADATLAQLKDEVSNPTLPALRSKGLL